MVRPIVFLDCDGVIKTPSTLTADTFFIPEEHLTARLEEFCTEVDAIVVVSSTWRRFLTRSEFIANVGEWLEERIPNDQTWCTTLRGNQRSRGDEIEAWLIQNSQVPNHPHVIFDDDTDFAPHQPLVRCDETTGLSEENLREARNILEVFHE